MDFIKFILLQVNVNFKSKKTLIDHVERAFPFPLLRKCHVSKDYVTLNIIAECPECKEGKKVK
jgi:hypothetical protein